MLEIDIAYKILTDSARILGTEKVNLDNALNRILAEDVFSDINMPPFDKSVMDGYACRRCDLGNPLKLMEIIPAGYVPEKTIQQNQCSKIMTGAMLPQGADCVFIVEESSEENNMVKFTGAKIPDNITRKADFIKQGDVVLRKGIRLKPQHIGVLATVGCVNPVVYKLPKIGVIATGDELVEPDIQPGISRIRNSNSIQLCSQIRELGIEPNYYGICRDNKSDLDAFIKAAARENDITILSGGVSMGDYDFVPDVLKQNNIDLKFQKLCFKPGKPTVFGIGPNGAYFFGVPGNPVSTLVVFDTFIKPFIYKLMGHEYHVQSFEMELSEDFYQEDAKRVTMFPVKIQSSQVTPLRYKGSAHINIMTQADGLVKIDKSIHELQKGQKINVRPI